jgi:hypothetical protein
MNVLTWKRCEEALPWPWVAVKAKLQDGRDLLAIWTGNIWWGDNRQLEVKEWRPLMYAVLQ